MKVLVKYFHRGPPPIPILPDLLEPGPTGPREIIRYQDEFLLLGLGEAVRGGPASTLRTGEPDVQESALKGSKENANLYLGTVSDEVSDLIGRIVDMVQSLPGLVWISQPFPIQPGRGDGEKRRNCLSFRGAGVGGL